MRNNWISSSKKPAEKKKAVAKKKRGPTTKKKAVDDGDEEREEEKDEEEEEDKEEEDTEIDKEQDKEEKDDRVENSEPKQVTDKALRRWVQTYVACFNMDKTTIKPAMETTSDKFGIDLKRSQRSGNFSLRKCSRQQLKTTRVSCLRSGIKQTSTVCRTANSICFYVLSSRSDESREGR